MCRRWLLGTLVLGLIGSAFASGEPNVVGKWAGVVDVSKMEWPEKDVASKGMLASIKKQMLTARLSLELKANHTYKVIINVPNEKPDVNEGPWSQKGFVITFTQGPDKTDAQVSKDGKTIRLAPKGAFGAVFVFKKLAK